MLDVFKTKIENKGITNVKAKYQDPEDGDALDGQYDLIVSSMSLHHIKNVGPLLKQFYGITAPGGHLCIADLDLDDGQFHESNEGVFHFGFDRAELGKAFTEAGLRDIKSRTAAEISKPISSGGTRTFSIFLISGRKVEKI
jgi:SAM-dependent methyltransferase